MSIKRFKDFINESGASYTPPRTGSAATYGSQLSGGVGQSTMYQSRRGFTKFNWDDFVNIDFIIYQDNIELEEEPDNYSIYKLNVGDKEYIFKPVVFYINNVTHVHLTNTEDGVVYSTISEEIPESKDLKKGEFYINPNIDEYESVLNQLEEQGFISKKDSNQIVGEKSSDIYKVLSI